MGRMKIGFGMDLGTSNSAIAVVEHDKIRMFKSERYLKDTTPSCVHFNRKKTVFVGDDALNRHRGEVARAFRDGEKNFAFFEQARMWEKKFLSSTLKRIRT